MTSDDIMNMVEEEPEKPKGEPKPNPDGMTSYDRDVTKTERKLLDNVLKISRKTFGKAQGSDLRLAQALMVLMGKE